MSFTIRSYNSDGKKIPNAYTATSDETTDHICLLMRSPAGWRLWRRGNLFPTAEAAVQARLDSPGYKAHSAWWQEEKKRRYANWIGDLK